VFASVPGAGRALVECDGIEPSEVKTVLEWKVQSANRYANFDSGSSAATIRPGSDTGVKDWTWSQWIDFAGEPPSAGKPTGKMMFETAPAGLRELASLKPADATIKSSDFPELTGLKPADAGASVADLATPDDDTKPE
jgi:hypothetical protein